jgi:hypothetical protein
MTDTALRLITAFKAARTQDEYDSAVADLYGSDLPTKEYLPVVSAMLSARVRTWDR